MGWLKYADIFISQCAEQIQWQHTALWDGLHAHADGLHLLFLETVMWESTGEQTCPCLLSVM